MSDGSAPPDDGEPVGRRVAAGMLALIVAMGIGRFAFTPILPAMRDAFALPTATLGALASGNYLGYLIGALAAALFAPALFQTAIVRAGLLVVGASTLLMAATTDVGVWIALRFVAGLASAGVFVFGSGAVLAFLAGRGRSELVGVFYGGVGIGIALSGLAVLAVDTAIGGATWRADWIVVAAVAALLTVPTWAWLPRSDAATGIADLRHDGAARRLPRPIVPLAVAYFCEGAGYIVSGTFLVAIVAALPGLAGLGTAAWILVGLAAVPSTILWAWLGGRIGRAPALVAAYVGQAVGLALPALSSAAWAAAASALLLGGTFVGITALTLEVGRGLAAPRQAARAIATLTAAFGLGQVVGPPVAAVLAGPSGAFGRPLLVAAGAVLFGGLLTAVAGTMAARRGPVASSAAAAGSGTAAMLPSPRWTVVSKGERSMQQDQLPTTDAEWRARLTPEQYDVLRRAGTERPFSGEYVDTDEDGVYRCAACGNPLFDSTTKFHSGTGWPSFTEAVSPDAVELVEDRSHGMRRTEVRCSRCHSHLGHVFDDGPRDRGGQRFCMNSLALDLKDR